MNWTAMSIYYQDEFPQYVLITNEYDPGRLVNTDGLNRRAHKSIISTILIWSFYSVPQP
jgi:hypothetical protein